MSQDKTSFRRMMNFFLGRNELEGSDEKLLYMLIWNYPHKTFVGYQEHLADLMGVSTRTVRRVAERLVEKGLIRKNVIYNLRIAKRTVSYTVIRDCEKSAISESDTAEILLNNEII